MILNPGHNVGLETAQGHSAGACRPAPHGGPRLNGPRLGGPVRNQRGLAGSVAPHAHAARPRRGHRAPTMHGGTTAGGSPLPAPRCDLAEEDEGSPGSTPEVATQTEVHQRRVLVRRWFGGGGNGSVWSSMTAVRRSAVVGGSLQNRRGNANEEEGGQFMNRSSGGWSSLRSAMATASFVKFGAEGASFRRLTVDER
jgi:hypothetical protein